MEWILTWPRLMLGVSLLFTPLVASSAEPPALMLATVWDRSADPTDWWMSEKYDGVRGYWTGTQMFTRQGEPIHLPATLRATLPSFALDGELWSGRGRFEQTLATVRDLIPGPGWSDIRYMIFDLPGHDGPFEIRNAELETWLREHPSPWLQAVPQIRCTSAAHMEAFLAQVERAGGEGIMLRAPGSFHTAGRSAQLRKVKSFDDMEGIVRGYRPGKGKYTGLVGALIIELPDGTRFALGTGLTDAQRHSPPPPGSVITFRHHGWTARGKPRFPVFWRVRETASAPIAAPDKPATSAH